MVVGLLGNKSSGSNRFTLVAPKPENGVRLQAKLGNQNPTGLPVGVVSEEIQKLRGCSCSCSDGIIDDVEDILDKLIENEVDE